MKKAFLFSLLMLLFGSVYSQSEQPLPVTGVENEVFVKDSTIYLISTNVNKVAVTPKMLEEQAAKLNDDIKKAEQYLADLRANLIELERVKAVVAREQKKISKKQ